MSLLEHLPSHLVGNAKVLSNREDILDLIEPGGVFVEVGVAFGDFTCKVLERCQPRVFVAIDLFDIEQHSTMWGRPMEQWLGRQTHERFYASRFDTAIAAGWFRMMIGDASARLEELADNSVDACYIDAGHGYEELKEQLRAAEPKLRRQGLMIVNVSTYIDFHSEPAAVNGVI